MVVPLTHIFAQHPPTAAILPLIVEKVEKDHQLEVLSAVQPLHEDRLKDRIFKLLVSVTEQRGKEVDPDVWEAYYALKTPAKIAEMRADQMNESPVRYDLPNGRSIEIRENRDSLVLAGDTGHRTWESSLALTEYICCHASELNGEVNGIGKVIELGCGTGLVSLAMAELGLGTEILATDGSELVIDRLKSTISQNAVNSLVKPIVCDWLDLDTADRLPKGAVVVAGDILYGLPSMYSNILDLLSVLQPERILFCNPVRDPEAYEQFKRLCVDRNVKVSTLARYPCKSAAESEYMYLVSVPPIPVELIELTL